MKVINVISAIDYVYECINDDECELCWDDVSNLIKDITDRNMESSFDCIVCNEFPNGVEDWEFCNFVKNEQDYIYKELGIDKENNI